MGIRMCILSHDPAPSPSVMMTMTTVDGDKCRGALDDRVCFCDEKRNRLEHCAAPPITEAGARHGLKWADLITIDERVFIKCDSCGFLLRDDIREEDCPSCAKFCSMPADATAAAATITTARTAACPRAASSPLPACRRRPSRSQSRQSRSQSPEDRRAAEATAHGTSQGVRSHTTLRYLCWCAVCLAAAVPCPGRVCDVSSMRSLAATRTVPSAFAIF